MHVVGEQRLSAGGVCAGDDPVVGTGCAAVAGALAEGAGQTGNDEVCAFPPKPQEARLGWGTQTFLDRRIPLTRQEVLVECGTRRCHNAVGRESAGFAAFTVLVVWGAGRLRVRLAQVKHFARGGMVAPRTDGVQVRLELRVVKLCGDAFARKLRVP